MTARLVRIWRHPIKSHGREALERTRVAAGETLPWDRAWAVRHEASEADGSAWAPCANFSRGAKAPALMAIDAALDEDAGRVTLTHPDREPLTFRPDDAGDTARFLDWVRPLMPAGRAASAAIVRVDGRGMTDTPYPSISLGNLATLDVLGERMGQPLDPRRFRMNLWVEGLPAWSEFDLSEVGIGSVRFRVEEPVTRCLATTANPKTGARDADTLGALETGWGHRDFGIYLTALTSGEIALGDEVTT